VPCLEEDAVLAFTDGRLAATAIAAIEAHLAACSKCTELVALAAGGKSARSPRAAPIAEPLGTGASVGRYIIIRIVGRGGMADVYLAHDPELSRRVALKLLHGQGHEIAARGDGPARLLREARAIARLSHPNVVVVHDAGTVGERVFIAMEHVEGETLAAWVAARPRTWREIRDVFVQAARGLEAAHAAGLVHRDFKPQNAMVGRDGKVRVMDFGLVSDLSTEVRGAGGSSAPPDLVLTGTVHDRRTVVRTRTGALIGTPGYMAPEQFLGEPADERTDQFSFCVALYEALYGERPFRGDSLDVLRKAVTEGSIAAPSKRAGVPAWVRRVVLRGLSVRRADRFLSMTDLLRALDRDPARRWTRAVAVAAAGLLLVGGGAFVRHTAARGEALCRGAAERLAAAWETAAAARTPRRDAIRAAFSASKRTHTEVIWRLTAAALDRYVTEWESAYADACEATHVRGEQSEVLLDLRMSCLGRRRDGLRALTDLLVAADAPMVDRAIDAALALPAVASCADRNLLQAAIPPPEPSVRAHVEELQRQLAQAKALHDAGRSHDALAITRPLLGQARALAYGPLVAEAQLQLALQLLYEKDAEKETRQALVDGETYGQDEVVATAAVLLVYQVGYAKGRREEGWSWAQFATAALRRIGGHERLWAWLHNHQIGLLMNENRYAEALAESELLRDSNEKAFGPDHPDVGLAVLAVAESLSNLKRPTEALIAIDRAIAIFEQAYGPGHSNGTISINTRGEIFAALGRRQEARRQFEEVLATWTKELGPDHPYLAFPLTGLGRVALDEGRPAAAVPLLERAVRLRSNQPSFVGRLEDSQLALATALWGSGADRRRAVELARAARQGYAALPSFATKIKEADEWLRRHSERSAGR
jgi:eukaryotic-like serine/threonine-protein kinase